MTNNIINKPLPHCNASEQSFLSAIINDPESLFEVSEIREEMFYSSLHKKIFRIIMKLNNLGVHIEQMQLAIELDTDSEKRYLNDISDIVLSGMNIKKYAKRIIDTYYARENILVFKDGIEKLYDINIESEKTVSEVQSSIKTNLNDDDYAFYEDVHDQIYEEAKNVKEGNKEVELFTTGLHEIDNVVKLKRGALLIVGARPSHGKSVFAKVMALANVKNDKTVAIFSLEMKPGEQVERIIPDIADIKYSAMVDKRYIPKDKLEILKNSKNKIKKRRLIFTKIFSLNFQRIRTIARKIKNKHGLDIIIIDYLQLMEEEKLKKQQSRADEVGDMTRLAKIIANELDILVVVLSQLNRNCENRHGIDKIPILADLRDSGRIEQDADHVIFLAIPLRFGIQKLNGLDMTKNSLVTRCPKNRNSTTYGLLHHYFDGEYMTIKDEIRY